MIILLFARRSLWDLMCILFTTFACVSASFWVRLILLYLQTYIIFAHVAFALFLFKYLVLLYTY